MLTMEKAREEHNTRLSENGKTILEVASVAVCKDNLDEIRTKIESSEGFRKWII